MVEKSLWTQTIERDPEHSRKFIQRFRDLAAAGNDIVGEARFVDAMAPRGARIFDAGCGTGRTGGELARLGHTVVGMDVDPALIEAARAEHPSGTWLVGDLAELAFGTAPLADADASETFDIAVAAGNVMAFLAPSTRRDVLRRIRAVLKAGGRFALGFGAGRGYAFDDFFADAAATGWQIQGRFRGWNLLPFEAGSEFLVAILSSAPGGRLGSGKASPGVLKAEAAGRSGAGPRPREASYRGQDPMAGNRLRPLR